LRLSSVRILSGISCVLFGVAAWRLGPHSVSDFAAQAQTANNAAAPSPAAAPGAQLQPVSATTFSVNSATAKPATIPPLQPAPPPGTEVYAAKRGEAIPTVARRYLDKTSYLTSAELADAIRHVNGDRTANILKANENIIIPGILPAPIVEKTIPVAKDFEIRAVYLTGVMAGSDHGLRIIRHWREVGGNAVVFDIKDSDGSLSIPFDHPLVGKHNVYIHDLAKFVHFVHHENMHAIARIAIFRDEALVKAHPELAVQSRRNKTAWRENGKLVWTDPSQPKVQEYNIALAKYVAQLGADEIQFDYVRFPAEGDQKDASFVFQKDQPEATQAADQQDSCGDGRLARPAHVGVSAAAAVLAQTDSAKPAPLSASPGGAAENSPALQRRVADKKGTKSRRTCPEQLRAQRGGVEGDDRKAGCNAPRGPQRSDVITAFLQKAYAAVHPTGALFSLDVFGVMAWQRPIDLSHTGQDIVQMARYCDVLSPMIYPSHFFGMDHIPHPGDSPEHFIAESMDRFQLITHPDGNKTSGVVIRPWLQAFHWRTRTYSPEYIKIQVETARNKGGIGFLFWNAGNDYSKPFIAMPEMKAENYSHVGADAFVRPANSNASAPAISKDGSNSKDESSSGSTPKDAPGASDGAKDKYRYFRGDELPAATVQASLTPAN
jgi:hypothetical protein